MVKIQYSDDFKRDAVASEYFPNDVMELQALLGPPTENQAIHAIPGENTNVKLWILGSRLFGAQFAALFGLPYAFASHFAPQALMQAVSIYREQFKPSAQLAEPYVMVGCNVIVADNEDEAKKLFTSPQQQFAHRLRGGASSFRRQLTTLRTFGRQWKRHSRRPC